MALEAGQVIVDLYRNLEEIRSTLGTSGPEAELVRGAIERAEEQLRHKARVLVDATRNAGGLQEAATWPRGGNRFEPSPPTGIPPPAPPAKPRPLLPNSLQCEKPRLRQRAKTAPRGSRARSKTAGPQRMLPRPNRLDPLSDPPALTEGDLDGGLLNLVNRGFIPSAADITPALERGVPVVLQRPAPLYDQMHKWQRREISTGGDFTAQLRLDNRPAEPQQLQQSPVRSAPQLGMQLALTSTSPSAARSSSPPPATKPKMLPALPAPQYGFGGSFGEAPATFYTELLDGSCDSPEPFQTSMERSPQSIVLSKDQIRTNASTKIAAHWKGVQSRREVDELRLRHRAAARLQQAWCSACVRAATKSKIMAIREEERKRHVELMFTLEQDWFHMRQQRRVEIHICSNSIAPSRRRSMLGYKALQASQIGRAFRLLDKRIDIIFVAPRALHEDIVDYYSKIMQYRGVRNPAGRFQVVTPEYSNCENNNMCLTQALLCSPRALRRLKKLVGGRSAVVVPDVVSHAELKLCSTLGLPMLSAGPRNVTLLSSKSNAKRLVSMAELPAGPWAVDIYDEDEFYASLSELIVRHPEVRHWVFKIDDERNSRGHAYIDLAQMRSVADVLRSAQANNARANESSTSIEAPCNPEDIEQVQQALRKHLPRKVVICNRRAYPDFGAWLAESKRVGMVVQAVPESLLSQTSVHLQIDPDGTVSVLGTSEAVCSQPFIRAASWYPHTRGSWEVLREVGTRMGRVLAGKGLVGFASIDVVFFENPEFDASKCADADREFTPAVIGSDTPVDPDQRMFDFVRSPSPEMSVDDSEANRPSSNAYSLPESRQADYDLAVQLQESANEARDEVSLMLGNRMYALPLSRWACWVVDVDAHLTDEAVALFPLQFVAQVKLDQSTGDMRLTPEAQSAQSEQSGGAVSTEEDSDMKTRRWALVSHAAHTPGMEKMSYQSLFQAAKMRGVSYDLFNNVGCLFTFLDVFNSLFSLLSIERTAEACAKRLASAVAAVTEPLGPRGQAGAHAKMSAPRDAPLPVSMEGEAQDGLTISDVQMALRTLLRQFTERNARRTASR